MTIVEGQIETLKKLKESLSRSGITRFGSIGEIRRFLKEFELEKKQLPNRIENEVEAEIQDMQSTLANHRQRLRGRTDFPGFLLGPTAFSGWPSVAEHGFDMSTEWALANVDLFGSTPFSVGRELPFL